MKTLIKYAKFWWIMSRNSFMAVLSQKFGMTVFLIGKVLRFVFFLGFIYYLLRSTKTLAGYDLTQTMLFYLTFNIVDIISQFLYREVYRFRPLVVSGSFDLVLIKPVNALFRSLMGGADLIDLFTIPPLLIATYFVALQLNPTPVSVAVYVLLVLNGLVIATAFHIAVLSLAIITLEIDHTVMIYRDLQSLGRLPVEIYKEPIRSLLTFFIPIGIMVTFPAKALMNLLNPTVAVVSLAIGAFAFFAATKFWNYALKYYTSASS